MSDLFRGGQFATRPEYPAMSDQSRSRQYYVTRPECPAMSDQSRSRQYYVTRPECPAMEDQPRGGQYVTRTEFLQVKDELESMRSLLSSLPAKILAGLQQPQTLSSHRELDVSPSSRFHQYKPYLEDSGMVRSCELSSEYSDSSYGWPSTDNESLRSYSSPSDYSNTPRSYDSPSDYSNTPRSYDSPSDYSNTPRSYDSPSDYSNTTRSYDSPSDYSETLRSFDPLSNDGDTLRSFDLLSDEGVTLGSFSDDGDTLFPSKDSTSLQPYNPSLASCTSSELSHRMNTYLDDTRCLSSSVPPETLLKKPFDNVPTQEDTETYLKVPIDSISKEYGAETEMKVPAQRSAETEMKVPAQRSAETEMKVPAQRNPSQDSSERMGKNLQDLFKENGLNKSTQSYLGTDMMMMYTASLTSHWHKNKPKPESQSQIQVNWDPAVPPLPSNENTLNFYIGDFENLVKSDHTQRSPPKDIDELDSSVRGQVLFLKDGKLSVWLCGRHPRLKPPECTLNVKATIANPRGQPLDLMVGEATWTFYEKELEYKGKWEKHLGAIDCQLVKKRGYVDTAGHKVLVRYLVEVKRLQPGE